MNPLADIQSISDYFLLKGSFCQDVSFFHGKMGISTFFFLLSRHTGNMWYEEFAGELLEDVCTGLSSSLPITFADGLCGIGWSIEFLKQKGFVEGNTDYILSEIDAKIMKCDLEHISDPSLEYGIGGLAAYVYCRQNTSRAKNYNPFSTFFVEELKKACYRLDFHYCNECLSLSVVWKQVLDSFSTNWIVDDVSWQYGLTLLEQGWLVNSTMDVLDTEESSINEQYLFEEHLRYSTQKYLFIFSESAIGADYGVGTYIKQLVKCFSLSEWNVNVVTLQVKRDNVFWKLDEGISYYEIPFLRGMCSVDSQKYAEIYSQSVFYYLSARMPSIGSVYCHFNFFGYDWLAALCRNKWHARIFFTVHYADWSFSLLGDTERLQKFLSEPCGIENEDVVRHFRAEQNFMKRHCTRIIAVALHSYVMLRDIYGIPETKLALVPNGLEDAYKERTLGELLDLRRKYGFESREKIILFVGRLELLKGVLELIEAFKLLRKEIPNVRLVIVGNGNFAKCLDVAKPDWTHISFTGFLPLTQLSELYAISDIGVVPSLYEKFGYVALEMMMNKLPILVNDCAGLRELTDNGKYGTVFQFGKERNVENLKVALFKMLQKGICEKHLVESRNWALTHYSISVFQKRINEIYHCEKMLESIS